MQKKISEKQLTANKINSKLGGVKTEKGKEVSRFNARKHGILGNLLSECEENILKNFSDHLFEDLNPKGFIEEILVEKIAYNYLRLFRVATAEIEFINEVQHSIYSQGYPKIISHSDIHNLESIFLRYDTNITNQLFKALHELERIQKRRVEENISTPTTLELNNENGFVSQKI